MARSRQRRTEPLRVSTRGARMRAEGSSPRMVVSSSFSSCFALGLGEFRCRGAGLVAVDEVLQVFHLGLGGLVRPFVADSIFLLEFEVRVHFAGVRRELAAGEVERVVAGGPEEGPVVGDDQARGPVVGEEVFEENLRPQVEEVRRFVEQQQVRLVQQQGGELRPRLPAAGERADGAVQVRPFDFELPGHFAALPFGLAAVAHQVFDRRLARQERVVLAEVAEAEAAAANDLARVEFLFAEEDAQECTFPRPVPAHEADLHVVGNRAIRAVEEDLVAEPLGRVRELKQARHRGSGLRIVNENETVIMRNGGGKPSEGFESLSDGQDEMGFNET